MSRDVSAIHTAAMPVSVRYGIDTVAASKPIFGFRGSWFAIFVQYASIIGWNCLLIILLERATAEVLASGDLITEDLKCPVQVVVSLVTIVVAGSTRKENHSRPLSLASWLPLSFVSSYAST